MHLLRNSARLSFAAIGAIICLLINVPAAAVPVQVMENFDDDPLWDGFNNRSGNNNFGFSTTNHTGAASGPGEVGGAVGNTPRAYYAANIGSLDPSTDMLIMQGTAYVDIGPTSDDGQHFWGWFDKDNLGGTDRPDNFIGIYTLRDPPYQMRLLWYINGSSNDLAVLIPEVIPETSFTYELTYDPNANGGNGSLSASTSIGFAVTLDLPPGRKDAFLDFDRFGMISDRPGPTIVPPVVFHDDITYTTNDSVLFPLGDFNRDNNVTVADYSIMKSNWLTTGHGINDNGEVTGDGIVDLKDFKRFKEELFTGPASALSAGVPEPSTIVLLLITAPTGLYLLRRRRWLFFRRVMPLAVVGLSLLFAFWTMTGRCAATETQNFDTEVAAAATGWTGVDNRNASFGTDFGFSDTNSAGGVSGAGEAGGFFPRRAATSPRGYYADTTIGTFSFNDRLEASGRVVFFTDNMDGGIQFGWFNTALPSFAGIQVVEGNRYQALLRSNNGAGSSGGLQTGAPTSVSAPFSLVWDPLTSSLTATIGDFTNTAMLSSQQLAVGGTFNTFGLLTSGGGTTDLPNRRGRLFVDDLTYTSVNPPSLELRVNRFSGATRIVGVGGAGAIELDQYTASSNPANPPLENVWIPANWNSIRDQQGGSWQEVASNQQQISESNAAGSTTLVSGSVISLGNVYNTADTAKDISFSYSVAGDSATKIGNVVFDGGLRLRVNKTTGQLSVINNETVGNSIDGYVIQSPSGLLNTASWNSLQNQAITGWEEIASSNNMAISELNLNSSSLLPAGGGSFNLGNTYAGGGGGNEDLTFTYSIPGSKEVLDGIVEYSAVVPGDYNENGTVDAADYVVWRNSSGQSIQLPNEVSGVTPGMVTQDDYVAWRARFGNTSGSGAAIGATTVPEPGTILLTLLGLSLANCTARTVRQRRLLSRWQPAKCF